MLIAPTPRLILETLLPHLKVAAAYAHHIQPLIATLPAKTAEDNFFAAALTDADLAVQNLVEVALLGTFPELRFYGEEHEQSRNTKYFRGITLDPKSDYLVTLDPIDGTQFYLDGHRNYQIIVTVLTPTDYAAVLALSPALDRYYYALKGEGTFVGRLGDGLETCSPLRLPSTMTAPILLGWGMNTLAPFLQPKYEVIDLATAYSSTVQIPNLNGILSGEIAGAVIRAGKWIDGAALAFLAREAGCTVTTLAGQPLPPLHTCEDYSLPGLIIATSPTIQQHLLMATQQARYK